MTKFIDDTMRETAEPFLFVDEVSGLLVLVLLFDLSVSSEVYFSGSLFLESSPVRGPLG